MSYRENYNLIDWSKPLPELPRKEKLPPARSDLAFPMVISDCMSETEHPCDGRLYTSKRAFRQTTKDNGCIEVGNDPQRFKTPKRATDSNAIDRSLDKAISQVL